MNVEITVEEFIEWLKTQDKGAIVQCVDHDSDAGGYYGGVAKVVNFDPTQHIDFTDFRNNQFTKPEMSHYGKRYLLIGRSE